MEIALVGSLSPRLAVPSPYVIAGGFRLVELAALSTCEEGKAVIYVEDSVELPLILEGCKLEVRKGVPRDVPKVHVGCVPYLLRSRNLRCGGSYINLGGEELVVEPLTSLADIIEKNVEIMNMAFDKLRELGVELIRGDVKGVTRGLVYVRGKIYEYTYVEGPAVVGPSSAVLPFTYVRPGTALYFDSKIREEAKNAILDAYTRKQHTGYLGDAYVSAFVNMGAGTTVSNLKNTLGLIRPSYTSRAYRKLGPILGEFVKTAIGTLIYGGRYVGPLSHVYGVVDRDVPPLSIFKNGEVEPMDRDKAVEFIQRDLAQFGRSDLGPYFKARLIEQSLF